jgi:hypothetical protein
MRSKEVDAYKRHLDDVFSKASMLPDSLEVQAHWARYLCILVSGFLETSVQAVLREYARDKASPNVQNCVESRLKQLQNAKMHKILELLGAFSPEWRNGFESATKGECADAVNSVVGLRNNLAHGDSAAITLSRIAEHYKGVLKAIEILENQCV